MIKLALIQIKVHKDKNINLKRAEMGIKEAAKNGAEIICLPEMFNCPYDNNYFVKFAETYPNGNTIKMLAKAASENNVFIIGGSIPELYQDKLYNTCFIFNQKGEMSGRYRKIHLFDVDLKGMRFYESDTLSPGSDITIVDTGKIKLGIAICYDMRFPELMSLYAKKGVQMMVIPAAFNTITGPAHWEVLLRARAIDNQVFVAAISPARDETASYVAYGDSMVVGPWGNIITKAGIDEEIIYADIDLSIEEEIRKRIPLLKNRRM
ncbi:MAG: carbon-nitrogen hydrolase family protein [Thermoanaerobacteraceae bacterium]|nr:carbon-nitrogen hydrolase family protein [Thermoanaerobacteraceae bacterium]